MSSFVRILLFCSIFGVFYSAADIVDPQPAIHEGNAVRLSPGVSLNSTGAPVSSEGETRQYYNMFGNIGGIGSFENYGNFGGSERRRCPLCDSSVFPYCGEKLFHDACCCTDPYRFPLPHKCHHADCAFLHANSCREHRLISNCCCSDEYRSLLRDVGKSDVPAAETETKKT